MQGERYCFEKTHIPAPIKKIFKQIATRSRVPCSSIPKNKMRHSDLTVRASSVYNSAISILKIVAIFSSV